MSTDGTRWLERHQAWERIRGHVATAAAGAGWRLTRIDSGGARARLHFSSDVDGAAADLWVMAPREGERAFRVGAGFLFGHGVLPAGEAGGALLDHVFAAFEELAAQGTLAPALLVREPAPGATESGINLDEDGALRLRLTVACNERCTYCYNDDGSTAEASELIGLSDACRALAEARARGIDEVMVTGGEPTLLPWLPDVLHAAADHGFRKILLQTNATRIAEDDLVRQLAGIPGLSLFVSIPAHDAEVAHAVTARGDLHQTKVAGLQAVLEAGLVVAVNHVVCRQNLVHVEAFVEWLAATFAPHPHSLVFSFSLPAGRAWEGADETIPRYSEAVRPTLAGLRRAQTLGLNGHAAVICGIPTCIEPGLRDFPESVPRTFDFLVDSDRVKFPGCGVCPWSPRCPGVPVRYLELYGTGEFATLLTIAEPKE